MSVISNLFRYFGYQPISGVTPLSEAAPAVEKSDNTHREAIAQNPLAMAYASLNTQWGLRKPTKITFQTLRRMATANWVDRACIETLRDEVTAIPWDITPVNPKEDYDVKFQQYIKDLLLRPNRNNENWRTFIQKIVEDILVCDAGCFEKVRNKNDVITEIWHVDGATVKPCYDEHGVVGDPAYQQFLPGQKENTPMAEWNNRDFTYIMWNPQGSVDTFGFGLSPVEAGLAVGTAFLYAEAYTLGFFKTNTIPPMIINMGKEVPASEIDKFRAFLAAEMMGTQGFHTPIISSFNEGFDVKNLMVQPKDMAWEKYLEWQMKWKVALYRMSPQDIGFNVDMYKMEGEVQQELSQNKAINSIKGLLKQYIDAEIIADFGFKPYNYNLQFQWIDTDVVDPLDQAQVDKIYLQAGVKSINEVRQRDGLDPIEGGQKPLIVSGTTVMQLDPTPMMTDEQEALSPVAKSLKKVLGEGEREYSYQNTQLDLPSDFAQDVKAFSKKIPDAFLNTQKGGRETDIHVTVLYGLASTITPEQIKKFVRAEEPVEITLGKVTKFEGEKGDVLKIDVQSSGLHRLHQRIKENLATPGETFPVYHPHITIAYVNRGCCSELVGDASFEGKSVVIDSLTFSNNAGKKTILPLGMTPANVNKTMVEKIFSSQEGEIVSLSHNASAVCWMDDRGVTQPLFVTDSAKKFGFQVKSSFLDDKKGQEPPEAEVARLLRAMKVNTPDVQIMTYEQVLALLPQELYAQFTSWIDLKPPFDSQQWRKRWGDTRKSNYYIVTGYVTGSDLGNHDLQRMMATAPESYYGAISDFAKVWAAERMWYLGDRKPGHYIVTQQGNGYGVDYQFFKDKNSYEKTKYFLPKTLGIISPKLFDAFEAAVEQTAEAFGHKELFKGYRRHLPKDWERMHGYEDVEKRFAKRLQKGIWDWYKKATNVKSRQQLLVRKATEGNADVPDDFDFDPNASYITTGRYVFQNGKKFPISVLPQGQVPTADDMKINAADYQDGFDYGAGQALVVITPNIPQGITVRNAELYAPAFAKRANLVTDTIDDTMKSVIDDIIVRGIDSGATYGDIADQIQQSLGVDENGDPLIPGWRAERIARTEAQWAISEGMRQQYEDAGIDQVNISPAMTACDECVDVANGNPYTVGEVEGLLPIHPNCRCVLVGDYSDFLN